MPTSTLLLTFLIAAPGPVPGPVFGPVQDAAPPAPYPITAPVRDRGVYHVATGRWLRGSPDAAAGSEVLYNNSLLSGLIQPLGEDDDGNPIGAFDSGRVPSTSSPSNSISVPGTADAYTVDCFRVSYCSALSGLSQGLVAEFEFYGEYAPCTDVDDPAAPPTLLSFVTSGLPAGTAAGGFACWTIAFDLSGSSMEFTLPGDADGVYDGDPGLDSFGWGMRFLNVSGPASAHLTGVSLAGQCPPGGPGTPTTPQQGFGTTFGGVPGAPDATGLGSDDLFWFDAAGFGPGLNGVCVNYGPCGGFAANPYASFYLQLFGTPQGDAPIGTPYCSSGPNATGSAARISAEGTDPNADLVLVSTPVPDSSGQFFYGPMMLGGVAFGDGLLCVGGMTTRLLPLVNAGMMMQAPNTAALALDYSAPYASGLTGTVNFQHWFRSTLPGTGFDTSDAISVTF